MKSKFVKILLVLVLVILFIPYPTTSVPEWKVRVVDENGNPLANVEVRQTWSQGQGESEDSLISDEQGFVTFPARKQFLPIILRIPLRALESINHYVMPHGASTGGRAYIWSAKGHNRHWLRYYEGRELKNTLIIGN